MSGSPARTAPAEELFERRVLPLYHLAEGSAARTAAGRTMAARFHGGTPVDPCVIKETHVTSSHVARELVDVFFAHAAVPASEVVS